MASQTWEVQSSCTCENEDGTYASECFGCYEDDKMNLEYSVLRPWMSANGLAPHDEVIVKGYNMTWLRREGYKITEAGDVYDAFTLNGDFHLYFTISEDAKTLAVTRMSHDEPTGATFIVEPYLEDAE